jgi:lipid A ethanolaminephosphotransferase
VDCYVVIAFTSAGLSRTVYLILFACYIGLSQPRFLSPGFTLLPVNSLHNWLVFLSMPIVAISVMNISPRSPRS